MRDTRPVLERVRARLERLGETAATIAARCPTKPRPESVELNLLGHRRPSPEIAIAIQETVGRRIAKVEELLDASLYRRKSRRGRRSRAA